MRRSSGETHRPAAAMLVTADGGVLDGVPVQELPHLERCNVFADTSLPGPVVARLVEALDAHAEKAWLPVRTDRLRTVVEELPTLVNAARRAPSPRRRRSGAWDRP